MAAPWKCSNVGTAQTPHAMVKITPIPYSEWGPSFIDFASRDLCFEPRKPEYPTIRWLGSGPACLDSPTHGQLMDVMTPFVECHAPPGEARAMQFNNATPVWFMAGE